MTFKLIRKECAATGIFSDLCAGNGVKLFSTLEHSYDCKPKIPNGTYTCIRGRHRLPWHNADSIPAVFSGLNAKIIEVNGVRLLEFDTFMVVGVSGHSNLLFHWGCFNKDSDGCVLVGRTRSGDMVTISRESFAEFMHGLEGLDSFTLVVS